jgi:transcriptional regulator with XRE-family HTH domain
MASGPGWFSTDRYVSQRDDALKRFGRMLRAWRVRNNWTQYTASQWAKEAGFQAMAAGNLSNIEHGKAGNLRPSTIFQLADLNKRIAEQQWGTVRSRDLRNRLLASTAIVDADGTPWGPTEFWACSVGLLEVPTELKAAEMDPVPELSDEAARLMSQQWRMELQELLLEHDLDPIDALGELSKQLPQQHRRRFRQVMSVSGADYKASELLNLWQNGWLPEKALSKWIMQTTHN